MPARGDSTKPKKMDTNRRFQLFLSRFRFEHRAVVYVAVFGVIGISLIIFTRAATPTANFEAESSSLSGNSAVMSDANASGGQAVRFNAPTPPPSSGNHVSGPGIALPNNSPFKTTAAIKFELDNAQQLGAKWIREDVGWGINSQYTYHFNEIKARGIKVYVTLGSSGETAFGVPGTKYNSTNIIKLVNDLVPTYYGLGARDFEVLNEPNLNGYSASEYLAIVKAAYPRIKQLAPDARVWIGAIGIGSSAKSQFDNFVKPLFPEITAYLDGFSIHASDEPYPNIGGARWWSMQAWTWGPTGGDITDTIRNLLNNSGGASKPIILSEYNFPDNKLGNSNDLSLQATRVVQNITDTRYVGVANFTINDPDFPNFNMLFQDGTKKPVWDAFKQAVSGL